MSKMIITRKIYKRVMFLSSDIAHVWLWLKDTIQPVFLDLPWTLSRDNGQCLFFSSKQTRWQKSAVLSPDNQSSCQGQPVVGISQETNKIVKKRRCPVVLNQFPFPQPVSFASEKQETQKMIRGNFLLDSIFQNLYSTVWQKCKNTIRPKSWNT